MSDVPCVTTRPAPMEGGDAYNSNSSVQADGVQPALDLLVNAATSVHLDEESLSDTPIVIADYGSATGRNSLRPMSAAIAALRKRVGMSRPIGVMHVDLPENDFAALFRLLEHDPHSYLSADPAAYAFAIGRSFYGPVLPAGSVSLGWSSWSVQWLSRVPMPVPDHVQAAFSRDTQVRALYAEQARSDWRRFLGERSRELCRGGRLVILSMAADEERGFGYDPLMAGMHSSLSLMREEGVISADELQNMTIPTFGRTRSEFAEPFRQGAELYECLRLEQLEIFLAEDRIWLEYERSQDAEDYGRKWAAFSRASVFPTLALSLRTRQGDGRVERFMDRLEAEMASRLATSPQRMNMPLALLELRRT